jgi:hypothetical protein
MRRLYTISIVLFLSIMMANAQSVLVGTDWTDLNPTIENHTAGKIADSYAITGGTLNLPEPGTTTLPTGRASSRRRYRGCNPRSCN